MAKERNVIAEATDAEGTLVGVDLMNILSPMGQRGKGLYGDVKSPPRPGTREPQMSEDEFIVMLRRKLGPDFNSAMGIPVQQWGGEWKKSSTDMKTRIRAVQEVYQDMQRMRMTTVQAEPEPEPFDNARALEEAAQARLFMFEEEEDVGTLW